MWLVAAAAACTPGGSAAGRSQASPAAEGARPRAPSALVGRSWAEADALFRSDPRWLGADGAYSVPLGGDRVLWLFGDTLLAASPGDDRSEAVLVHNSVAIQHGRCPTDATLRFHWGERDGSPAAFLPGEAPGWLWPLHGLVLEGELTLFFLREMPADGPLGFRTVGWQAFRVADPAAPPDTWSPEPLSGFDSPFPVVVGSTVLAAGPHVLAYAVREPGNHDVYLLRWERRAFVAGDLGDPRWWDGERGWVAPKDLRSAPEAVFRDGQPELSVQRVPGMGYVAAQTLGFGATTIGSRTAPAPQGPWTAPAPAFRPPESEREGVLVYAAKGHAGLGCADSPWDLILTYVANTEELADLVAAPDLYYPRFVGVRAAPR
ncbi:MAG: hypothetical protein ACOC97_03750 [Myxococcota bacterium]